VFLLYPLFVIIGVIRPMLRYLVEAAPPPDGGDIQPHSQAFDATNSL
jgi:hypothetical protein